MGAVGDDAGCSDLAGGGGPAPLSGQVAGGTALQALEKPAAAGCAPGAAPAGSGSGGPAEAARLAAPGGACSGGAGAVSPGAAAPGVAPPAYGGCEHVAADGVVRGDPAPARARKLDAGTGGRLWVPLASHCGGERAAAPAARNGVALVAHGPGPARCPTAAGCCLTGLCVIKFAQIGRSPRRHDPVNVARRWQQRVEGALVELIGRNQRQ